MGIEEAHQVYVELTMRILGLASSKDISDRWLYAQGKKTANTKFNPTELLAVKPKMDALA